MATVLLLTTQCCLAPTNDAARSLRAMLEALAQRGDVCHSLGVMEAMQLGENDAALDWCGVHTLPTPLWRLDLAGVQHWRIPASTVPGPSLSPAEAQAFMHWAHVLVQRLQPDLVLCQGDTWLEPVLSAARQVGVRVLAYLADPARLKPDLADLSAYDECLSSSHTMAQLCHARFGVLLKVCRSLVTAPLDGRFNLQPERLSTRAERCVTMINPEPNKGGLLFLSLAAQMLRQAPALKFLAVEGRWGRAQWAAAGVDLAALHNLSWQPSLPDLAPVYARTALLLVPSLCLDVSGRVIAEALLAGVPVLATRSGGIAEQLNGGGILFDLADSMQGDFLVSPTPAELQPWMNSLSRLLLGPEAPYAQAVTLAWQASGVFRREETEPAFFALIDRLLAMPASTDRQPCETAAKTLIESQTITPMPNAAIAHVSTRHADFDTPRPSTAAVEAASAAITSGLQIQSTQPIPGFLFGLAQPSLVVRLRFAANACSDALVERWLSALSVHLPAVAGLALLPTATLTAVPRLLAALSGVVHRLQLAAGLTVLPEARLLTVLNDHYTLALPGPAPAALGEALAWAVQALDALAGEPRANALPEASLSALAVLKPRLARLAPKGSNQRHLLRIAYANGMPVLALPGGVFQLGWGRRSRLFSGTFSDATGVIATAWAKDKRQTNALLRMAGLPVPTQMAVATLAAAIAAAQRIGYPVLLKCATREPGMGVEAGLRNEADLRLAYARSIMPAATRLLEQHLPGLDYRVHVVQGEVLGAAQRISARILGDGLRSVTELVAAQNRERQPAGQPASRFQPIEMDAEALELLARDQLNAQSVLAAGQWFVLRRIANASRGGTSVDVTHLIHPDNAALCVQAAALLRLDIAGLDLLMPDISRSWREVGAGLCAVNAQPHIGSAQPWIFDSILQRFVVGRGRIPALLVLSQAGPSTLANDIVAALEHAGLRTGLVQGRGRTLLDGCRAQLMAPSLGAIVVVSDGSDLPHWGLPLDRFDALVLDDCGLEATELQHALALLEPHTASALTTNSTPKLDALLPAWGQDRWQQLASRQALVGEVVRRVSELADGG